MLVLPLISILSVLNKLTRNICGGGKQARTQVSMFWTTKVWFWVKYPCQAPRNITHRYKVRDEN